MKQKTCVDCGKCFTLSTRELQFYKEKGLQEPKRCAACRTKHKAQKEGGFSPLADVHRKGFFKSCLDRCTAAVHADYAFRSPERLKAHYKKHKKETGALTKRHYVKKANRVVHSVFAEKKRDKTTGDTIYFLPKTGELVRLSAQKYIRTYYIATQDYFNRS